MGSLQTLVRLWCARSAGELLLCPLWVAASPAASSVGVGGCLAEHSGNLCCTQWRWLLSSDQFVNLECTGAKRCERETDELSVYFWCRWLVLLFTG